MSSEVITCSPQWNITETFQSWVDNPITSHGIMMKDNLHASVPGHFLKFASKENSDPTKRPYLMACLKPSESHYLL